MQLRVHKVTIQLSLYKYRLINDYISAVAIQTINCLVYTTSSSAVHIAFKSIQFTCYASRTLYNTMYHNQLKTNSRYKYMIDHFLASSISYRPYLGLNHNTSPHKYSSIMLKAIQIQSITV